MFLNILGILKRYVPKLKKFDYPIDARLEYKGYRLIGESTTILGLIISIILSIIIYLNTLNYLWTYIPILVYLGHMLGSIIKRRAHKKGGEYMPIVDHGDYMITTGIVFLLLNHITFSLFIMSLLITYIFHPLICFLAFKLKLRELPY
jgi:hypothetical protein